MIQRSPLAQELEHIRMSKDQFNLHRGKLYECPLDEVTNVVHLLKGDSESNSCNDGNSYIILIIYNSTNENTQ